MGMYDEISVTCPKCQEVNTLQSKFGPCELKRYTLDNAPLLVIADINDEGVKHNLFCDKCDTELRVDVKFIASVRAVRYNEDDVDEYRSC